MEVPIRNIEFVLPIDEVFLEPVIRTIWVSSREETRPIYGETIQQRTPYIFWQECSLIDQGASVGSSEDASLGACVGCADDIDFAPVDVELSIADFVINIGAAKVEEQVEYVLSKCAFRSADERAYAWGALYTELQKSDECDV